LQSRYRRRFHRGIVEFVVVRSDNERIVVKLEGVPVEKPEMVV
jgi:hypothetical protein